MRAAKGEEGSGRQAVTHSFPNEGLNLLGQVKAQIHFHLGALSGTFCV